MNLFSSPTFATAIGLLMKGLTDKEKSMRTSVVPEIEEPLKETEQEKEKSAESKRSIFERWSDKFRDFLDNAE